MAVPILSHGPWPAGGSKSKIFWIFQAGMACESNNDDIRFLGISIQFNIDELAKKYNEI